MGVFPNFKVHVMAFCSCGWLMQDCESGTYCVNPDCEFNTHLYQMILSFKEVSAPKGAVA